MSDVDLGDAYSLLPEKDVELLKIVSKVLEDEDELTRHQLSERVGEIKFSRSTVYRRLPKLIKHGFLIEDRQRHQIEKLRNQRTVLTNY